LGLRESIAVAEGELHIAKLQADRDQKLFEEGLSAKHVLDVSLAQVEALETRVKLMRQRLEQMQANVEAQLAVQQAKVEQFRGLVSLRRRQLDDLQVKAGASGVLQQLMVEVGQQVTTATTLARVARPDQLKAELQVAETQMRDVQVGQSVSIDTRNGIIQGRVARIDPAVVNGAVKVEVTLEGELPKGARPDLSVEGVIEIERLNDVLHVARPVGSRPETRIGLFRLSGDGDFAVRTPVLLGRGSVNAMEIVEGLNEGDRVIISDMSKWEAVDKVRLR
jgi:multidrug efflux pump subunit AcrA (membrane-fusion protein)